MRPGDLGLVVELQHRQRLLIHDIRGAGSLVRGEAQILRRALERGGDFTVADVDRLERAAERVFALEDRITENLDERTIPKKAHLHRLERIAFCFRDFVKNGNTERRDAAVAEMQEMRWW